VFLYTVVIFAPMTMLVPLSGDASNATPAPPSAVPSGFEGASVDGIRSDLQAKGMQKIPDVAGKSEIWYDPATGIRVRVDADGHNPPNKANGPHIHVEKIDKGLTDTGRIRDDKAQESYDNTGYPSKDPDKTHINITKGSPGSSSSGGNGVQPAGSGGNTTSSD